MRPAWGVAVLFALPSLALSLLLQYAFTLDARGGPFVLAGVVVLPWIAAAGTARAAFARGLFALAGLSLAVVLVVHLRVWTNAGAPVLAREGAIDLSRALLVWALAATAFALWLRRGRRARPPGAPA